jgi:hypothetical protein
LLLSIFTYIYVFATFKSIIGLTDTLKQKELFRRIHILHPNLLPANLVKAIKPSKRELKGSFYGLEGNSGTWKCGAHKSDSVVIKLHGSSDGVRPFKTEKSSVRCIMGSLDSIESKKLGISVKIPDAPPFFIGIYQGLAKESDAVLIPTVNEMRKLRPPPLRKSRKVNNLTTIIVTLFANSPIVISVLSTFPISNK